MASTSAVIPEQSTACSGATLSILRRMAALAVFWCASLLLLQLSDAFTHELGGAPDESAHFMTGLMIHDYVVSGIKTAPLDFAKDYYGHYPKVAFGVWPPLFHTIEAAWMLLVSSSKVSIVFMLSGVGALLAYLLFRTVERLFGFAAGIWAGLLLISVPLMQQSTNLVMVDSTVALFSFLAILRFARYLENGTWQDAALFGVWASAAILSKYNGLALALVPPLCAIFTRRWSLLWRGPTWLAAGIVVVICGSWYLPMRHLVAYAAEPMPGFATVLPAMVANSTALAGMMGILVLLVAGAGMVLALLGKGQGSTNNQGIWTAAAALIVSCWLFHSIATPGPEPRYMLTALAPLILFLTAGTYGLSRLLHCAPVQVASVLSVVYAASSFTVTGTPHLGYSEVASTITREQSHAQSIILADGDSESEGMAVSEIAIHDRGPACYVIRGSKYLARSTWMGAKYQLLYQTPKSVLEALDAAGVSTVIVQANAPSDIPHHGLLRKALQSTETWQRWPDTTWEHGEKNLLVYRRRNPIEGPFCFEVPLDETLHIRLPVCTSGTK